MTLDDMVLVVQSVKEDFEREEDQGLLQRDLHKAEMALAGKYACNRILRAIEAREGIRVVDPRKASRAR
jgi:hypothetical protein